MSIKTGTLYGIGVGPGDPELIPLKSVRILNSVDIVYAASSSKNVHSLAVDIAKPHIPETTRLKILGFPMTSDTDTTLNAWRDHAQTVIKELGQGKNVAFITLGDPMTYSTYGYILKHIRTIARDIGSDINIVTIPGITSYQAAAARLNIPLVEGEESLLIVSGAKGGDRLRGLLKKPENIVFLKAYKNVKDINAALDEAKLYKNCTGISGCGHQDEKIVKDIKEFNKMEPNYWTLILAKQKD